MAIKDQPNVLQLSTMVPPARFGGAESVVGAFGAQLAEAGFAVRNVGLRARGADGAGVAIPNLYWPFDGRRRGVAGRLAWHAIDALTLSARGAVERVVDEAAPDVIVTHNLRGWGLAPWTVAQRRGIPLVHVLHDYGLLCNSSTLFHGAPDCDSAPCRLRREAALRRWPGGTLVGVSQAVIAEHQRRGFGTGAPSAVVHPVSAAHPVAPLRRDRGDGIPGVVGYLGRLSQEKGVHLLLEAIAGTGKQLVVAGEGAVPEVEALRQRGPADVRWRGWLQPDALFEEIDVLVVPSRWREPFGLVVVEAARAGVPVLIADQPGLIEAALAAGARHHVFAANNAAALRHSLDVPIGQYSRGAAPASADVVEVVSSVLAARQKGSVG